jgi:hypothetical protein
VEVRAPARSEDILPTSKRRREEWTRARLGLKCGRREVINFEIKKFKIVHLKSGRQ